MAKVSHFNGPDYDPKFDHARLSKQHERVRELMRDGEWRTLAEIEKITGDPAASISAQLRHLRKERFGSWIVQKVPRGTRETGLYVYRLLRPEDLRIKSSSEACDIPESLFADDDE
jgi:hypothetical protein